MKASLSILIIMFLFGNEAVSAEKIVRNAVISQARKLSEKEDFLGLRIWVRKSYAKKIYHSEWFEMKNLITYRANFIGFDLIPFWNLRNLRAKSDLDVQLERADSLMSNHQYELAFVDYQNVAKKLAPMAKTRFEAKKLIPYVYQSMGRALYGAGRYDEAVKVYQWISPNYPFFKQTLFEKMWAGFKAGRVDLALGAIASQRSHYFSKYLSPESYLIQTYLYKKLCREDDLAEVIAEMKDYDHELSQGSIQVWAMNDPVISSLWNLAMNPSKSVSVDLHIASESERASEKKLILENLNRFYQKQKPMILNDLKTALAYAHLASVTDTKNVLKPVKALKSRDELLKLDLEVWPADSNEEWVDELGKHVLIGESHCIQKK